MSDDNSIIENIMKKAGMVIPTPTVEEQAAAIYTEYENMWAAKRMAWIAGHVSRDKEVEELKAEISKLEGIIKENHRIASLVDKDLTEAKERIKELERRLSQIAQMSDPGSPERFVIEAKRIASKAEKV